MTNDLKDRTKAFALRMIRLTEANIMMMGWRYEVMGAMNRAPTRKRRN